MHSWMRGVTDVRRRRLRVLSLLLRILLFRLCSGAVAPRLAEQELSEVIQIALPYFEVVGAAWYDVIEMRHILLVEHFVNALANPEQPVPVATGNVQEPQFLGRFRV